MAFLDMNGLERLWYHIIAKLGEKADINHSHDDYVSGDEITEEEVEEMFD